MEREGSALWHALREHAVHWVVGGVLLSLTGFVPEEWVAHAVHGLRMPDSVLHLWSAGVDVRVVPIAIGVAVVAIALIMQGHALLPVPFGETQIARAGSAVAPSVGAAVPPTPVARFPLKDAPESLPPLGKPSIAVLAFTNMSGDIDQEYFSDGIAEDIITQLSHSSALNVIARNSSFTYKGQAIDVKQIGREFGVRYVLEGSVRRDGERVRVTTQLVEASTGNHIWAERFDRAVTDIFAVQDEIADAVARAIVPEISHVEQQRISRRPPESLGAWEAYQRGLWHADKANAADTALASEFFRQAIKLDPTFTPAYAELAFAHLRAGGLYRTTPMNDAIDLATKCAEAALAINARDAGVHAAMGWVLRESGHAGAAVVHIEQALAIDPNDARARRFKGALLVFDGHPAEGRALLLAELRVDPRSHEAAMDRMRITISYYFEGDYTAAAAAAERCITEHPGIEAPGYYLAASLAQLGRLEEAGAALRRSIERSPRAFDRWVTDRLLLRHRPEDRDRVIDGLRKAGWQGGRA
jgi:adenylate cyclase